MEELCADGEISNREDLQTFLHTVVALNLQEFELPYLRFAYEAAKRQDYDLICDLDEEIGASKPSKELRQASLSQGQQRLRLISKLRPSPRFEELAKLKREKRIVPQHLIIFATENVDLNTPLPAALAAWAYQAMAAPCAASLKLIRIGQEGAQTALTNALERLEPIIEHSLGIDREFAGAFLPYLDIASQRHEKAYSRLFIS